VCKSAGSCADEAVDKLIGARAGVKVALSDKKHGCERPAKEHTVKVRGGRLLVEL
jgi:hypothetical protein